MKTAKKTIGYLRVSTIDQDIDKFKKDIRAFANEKGFGSVQFVDEKVSGMKTWKNRKLAEVVDSLQKDDIMIVPELSRVGRSIADVLDVLNRLTEKQVEVYSVKENFQINGDEMQSKVMKTMFALFAEIDSDLRSLRTKEGQAAARKKGRIGGRPKGPGKSRLDKYREEIIALIQNGSQRQFIARRYGVTPATLLNWLKRHDLNTLQPKP